MKPLSGNCDAPCAKDDLIAAQYEVQRQLGDCLLRLQAYELSLKSLIGTANFRHRSTAPRQLEAAIPAELHRKTLGMLADTLMTSFFIAGAPPDHTLPDEDHPDGMMVTCRMRIALPKEEFQKTQADIRNLVALRNDLVHHFLEQNDLKTLEGCGRAQATLVTAMERITAAFATLGSMIGPLQEAMDAMAAYISSPEGRAILIHDQLPWHRLSITQALTEAAEACKIDGWASVSDAVAWINAHHPDERPETYGCQSWPQVIHETRLFDLRHLSRDGKSQRLYRTRGEI